MRASWFLSLLGGLAFTLPWCLDAHIDAHLRIDRETNNVVRRLAYGRVNMQPNFSYATLGIALNGRPVPFLSMGTSNTNWPTRWQAQIELTPGTHTLTATAVHPSNLYTNTTSVTFTNTAVDQTVLTYYSEGQLTQRVWKNSQGATNRVETYQWDARGRLHGFTERDVNGDGHDWTAVYDALGRKLQTQTVPVTNSVAYASQLKTVTHLYDPLVEFMDLGVRVDGRWHWKVYGPDLNGEYGGLNGTGGWDATVSGPAAFYPTIQDVRGNILGACDPATGSVLWNKARVTAYGSIPEHRPRSLGEGVSLWESGSRQGRFPELSGMYYLGMRYYQPVGGYFISADQGYDPGNPSDFSFASGDPVNFFDADGRVGTQNAPPPLEMGIAPVMQQSIYTDYFFRDGTSTGLLPPSQSILYDPGRLAANKYWTVTEPTGQYFSYVRDMRDGGPLADPNYGQRTETPITRYDVEQQRRVDFLKAVPMILLSLDGAGPLLGRNALIGVTSGEASALARQIYGIEVNGQRAVSSVEAFGSRAGSTFRGRGPLPTSDLDIRITLSAPAHFGAVNAEMTEIGTLFQSTKGFPLQSTCVIPGLPPPTLLQTPFIPLHP